MADAATTADAAPADTVTPDAHSFLWRRVHSLKEFYWTWGIAVGRLAQRVRFGTVG